MEYGSGPSDPEPGPEPNSGGVRRVVFRALPLLAAGAIGAGIAVGIGAAVDEGGTTTVVQQAAAPAAATEGTDTTGTTREPAAFESDEPLTVAELYRRSAPGVVRVTTLAQVGGDPLVPDGEQPTGTGSGFVVDTQGHIVTNYHVVQGAEQVEVTFSDQEPIEARVIGVDPSTDLAVLDVELPATALTPLPLGDSADVQVGDEVVAIGNPFGLDRTVTKGIVSALQRRIQAPNGFAIEGAIQTDAAINHGNSGGPLLNAAGEVIGVNAQIETGGFAQGNVGVGFAIPIDTVREVTAQLIETGEVQRAYLGVEMQTITEELAESFSLPVDQGVLIARVVPGTPADRAGLRGGSEQVIVNGEGYTLGGDVVTAVDGEAVTTLEELREIVLSHDPGDTIRLEVNRDGEQLTIEVELGRQPATPTG